MTGDTTDLFDSAEWYDRTIDWDARFARELPVLIDVFGPPGTGGVIDAGCGPGRHAVALADRGYRVIAVDKSEDMLALAAPRAQAAAAGVRIVQTGFERLSEEVGGGFDGLLCIGNSLAAAGDADSVRQSLLEFGRCLRPGGRMFVQILNFTRVLAERPCVRGPRVTRVCGVEYVSFREFHAEGDLVRVTSVILWNDGGWHQHVKSAHLYPLERAEFRRLCADAGLSTLHEWGGYAREPFDSTASIDLIVVAEQGTSPD